jgi:hypothetical protein
MEKNKRIKANRIPRVKIKLRHKNKFNLNLKNNIKIPDIQDLKGIEPQKECERQKKPSLAIKLQIY